MSGGPTKQGEENFSRSIKMEGSRNKGLSIKMEGLEVWTNCAATCTNTKTLINISGGKYL